ncbi:alpha/beta hydrolase [Macrococcus lamae]|uniref:Alpha/beta fold hydrolase n=1 Tax=Macrococcus lamae TaxID=198484 RepID=A0A4R6BS71_9STAP|nr:alpha/beta fold hydrolase [Macrococcus lamae]TDM05229.1 alpha/beta fold hydrolase [Macrococcus lamae]
MVNILEGAEPFYKEGSNIGILISHGFTGSSQSVFPLAEAYSAAGYTVCLPRLKGHGTTEQDMEQSTYKDWITSIEEGYEKLKKTCDAIFMTGLSMGGTLTLYMAAKHSDIRGIIPINAAVILPGMHEAAESSVRFIEGIGSDIKKPNIKEVAYSKTPVKSIKEIIKLIRIVEESLYKINCPVLVFVSPDDHVVPPYNADVIMDTIHSAEKEKILTEESYHVSTLDNDQAMIINKSLEFFKNHSMKN